MSGSITEREIADALGSLTLKPLEINVVEQEPNLRYFVSKEYCLFLAFLKNARRKCGLTQQQLAKKLKSTQSFVSKCERGERRYDVIELPQ